MIFDYLRQNPHAGDTLEGISRWWVELMKIDSSTNEVAKALDCLIQKGLVKRLVINGDNTIYKIH